MTTNFARTPIFNRQSVIYNILPLSLNSRKSGWYVAKMFFEGK